MRGWVAAMHTDVVGERMGDAKHRQRPPIGPLAVAIPTRALHDGGTLACTLSAQSTIWEVVTPQVAPLAPGAPMRIA